MNSAFYLQSGFERTSRNLFKESFVVEARDFYSTVVKILNVLYSASFTNGFNATVLYIKDGCSFLFQLLPTTVAENEKDEGVLISMYGLVVSMSPLGQMIVSPILGYLNTRMNSARPALLTAGALTVFGNTLYSVLSVFPEDSRYALLLVSRFITGSVGGGHEYETR